MIAFLWHDPDDDPDDDGRHLFGTALAYVLGTLVLGLWLLASLCVERPAAGAPQHAAACGGPAMSCPEWDLAVAILRLAVADVRQRHEPGIRREALAWWQSAEPAWWDELLCLDGRLLRSAAALTTTDAATTWPSQLGLFDT